MTGDIYFPPRSPVNVATVHFIPLISDLNTKHKVHLSKLNVEEC